MLEAYKEEGLRFESENIMRRLWQKDATVWTGDDEDKWLGWLTILDKEMSEMSKYAEFSKDVAERNFKAIVLLGMGGSSLCPEVLAITFNKTDRFHVLDSTVPSHVKTLTEKIDPAETLFIVASKSGSTLEPNAFMQHFYQLTVDACGDSASKNWVAITDPGSKLEKHAQEKGLARL